MKSSQELWEQYRAERKSLKSQRDLRGLWKWYKAKKKIRKLKKSLKLHKKYLREAVKKLEALQIRVNALDGGSAKTGKCVNLPPFGNNF